MNAYHSNGLGIGRRLKIGTDRWRWRYNEERPHMSLGISHPLNSWRS